MKNTLFGSIYLALAASIWGGMYVVVKVVVAVIPPLELVWLRYAVALLAAALTWALMSVLIKRVPGRYSPLVVTTYSICVAFVILTPFTAGPLQEIPLSQLARPEIWGGLLYLGVISTACAFMLWNRGLQLLNAASGGLFFFFQPLSGTLLGWLLLGETIGGIFWIGTALIAAGVVLVIKEK